MKIEGKAENRKVFIDGKQLSPVESQKVYNHSPDGFNWGYGGSGPAQLALALCLNAYDRETAIMIYQVFKWEVIAGLQIDKDFFLEIDFEEWLERFIEERRLT